MEKYYNVRQVAEILGNRSIWTIHGYFRKGLLAYVKVGSANLVAESELRHFLSRNNPAIGRKATASDLELPREQQAAAL